MLDVGCGPAGHVGRFVADVGARVVGVDVSERSLVLARRSNPRLRFVGADMHALPVRSGACAGIVAFYCLIYEAAEGTSATLVEFRRVLRAGGTLLIAVHGGEGVHHYSDYKGIAVDIELHLRTPAALEALVRQAGFAIASVEVRPPYPFEHATERLYVTARAA